MKNAIFKLVNGIFIPSFAGCSSRQFYSNPELKKTSGLKYYFTMPCLRFDRDSTNNSIDRVTTLYLPDLENPNFIAMINGIPSLGIIEVK
jgi:hypothetical protein